MKWSLVTYSDERFGTLSSEQQKFVHRVHSNLKPFSYNRDWIEKTDFYKKNKKILDHSSGGLWAWKPYIILDAIKKIEDGEILIYCDRKDMFSPGIFSYLESIFSEDDFCMLLMGYSLNKEYTKRDTFILMNCDENDYWNSRQLEAGFSVWKKTSSSISVLEEYLEYCLNYKIISDDCSELSEELPEFKEHRYDQSILTNLAIRNGLTVADDNIRNYIECDYPYWYERNEKNGFSLGREIDYFLLEIKNA